MQTLPSALALPSSLEGAVIALDLDGTLVDTAPDIMGTLNAILIGEGLAPLPLIAARHLVGTGARALLVRGFAEAGRTLDESELDRFFDVFTDHYLAHIADESRPFPGVVEALDALTAAGARLAVCTNKRTYLSRALLGALGLESRFAAIVGADEAPAPKPDARHLLHAIEIAGGAPGRAVMVGDSISDAGAARNAGVPLVLVSFGYTETPAAQLGADVLIDHFADLPAACERLLTAG